MDSSLRDIFKHSVQSQIHNGFNKRGTRHDREYSQVQRGILDSHKIDELFKSGGFRSEEEDSYD